ncbi:hypothetical protein HYALB_00010634 [Hymenoscyphus albidus]|uniref:Uncharacterized protein n=1 Tax=Hymenoscyphus albidus TaxID=595503 RepID=A0A9N9PTB5_9HELO|nr:hypothetical protein HYALB_00010634 [Hymenoscyphus albidus]
MGKAGLLLGDLSALAPKQSNYVLPQPRCSVSGKECVTVACKEREGKKKNKSALVSFCSSNIHAEAAEKTRHARFLASGLSPID